MSILVRKVTKSKWLQNNISEGESPSADAITTDLRTTKNSLSVWEIESIDMLEDAVLAIVSAGDHLDTIDVILFDSDDFSCSRLEVRKTDVPIPFKDFIKQHRDIVNLNYRSLGEVAKLIVKSISSNSGICRFSRGKLKKIINSGLSEGKVQSDAMNHAIIDKL